MYNEDDCIGVTFTPWNHTDNREIQQDFDILWSSTFADSSTAITATQMDSLLELFYDTTNIFDAGQPDFELITDYFMVDTLGYDADRASWNFLLFERCDTTSTDKRDHLDVYVGYISRFYRDFANGTYPPEELTQACEDPPLEYCPGPFSEPEYFANSIALLSPGTNAPLWKHRIASGVAHEYQHALRQSDGWEFGAYNYNLYVDEILSCAAEYMTNTPALAPFHDTPYHLSVFRYASDDMDWHYALWTPFAGYLLERYKGEDWEDQIVYDWVRETMGDSETHVTPCALAEALEDDAYSGLSSTGSGEYRLGRLHSDFAVAMWVNSDSLSSAYLISDDYSPSADGGFFRDCPDDPGHCWEDYAAPEFIVGAEAESTWITIPDASDCYEWAPIGQLDCADPDSQWCHPVSVKSWGANYFVFRTDTAYYTQSRKRDLRVRVRWPDLGDEILDHRIWLRVLQYPTEQDSLFLHGDELNRVRTGHYTASRDSIEFWVSNFCEDDTEAMVLVVTLGDTLLGNPCNHYRERLDYSFSYAMFATPPGGCPVASVWDGAGYAPANNLLAGMDGPEAAGIDYLLLDAQPAVASGGYSIRVSEDATDLSYFDALRLVAVPEDPSWDGLADTPWGPPIPYSGSMDIISAELATGEDITELVYNEDGVTARVGPGMSVSVRLREPDGGRGIGGMTLRGKPDLKIEQPFSRADIPAGTVNLDELGHRSNPDTWFIPFPDGALSDDGTLAVVFCSSVGYDIDYIATASAEVLPTLVDCPLSGASHSSSGDVALLLAEADGEAIVLQADQSLEVSFDEPERSRSGGLRFVLISEGYTQNGGMIGEANGDSQRHYALGHNFPNPFNPTTTIYYSVADSGGYVTVSVYDLRGRRVRTLVREYVPAGHHSVVWDGRDDQGNAVSSGVYFYSIAAPGWSQQKKMLLLK